MPPRPRKIRPRTDIPDWRDPEMPVIWPLYDSWTNRVAMVEVPPAEAQQMMIDLFHNDAGPSWRNDPSYHWSTRK